MNLSFYIKTRSINLDRRVHKMWKTLNRSGANISLVLCSNDKIHKNEFKLQNVREIKLVGGAAPQSTIKRMIGALQFSIYAFFLSYKNRTSAIHWVNDPILFPLVILLAKVKREYVVWDHHELPPTWVLENKIIKFLFRIAYKSANAVIHTNRKRAEHLELALSCRHANKHIIPNYPEDSEVNQIAVVELKSSKLGEYVYLQNTIGTGRCDVEIMRAVKEVGLTAVHAGNTDTERLKYLKKKLGDLDFCEFVGPRSLGEINYLLKNALCTTVFYRNSSMNNWLCEPNRLYQAKIMKCLIVAGHNPTLIDGLADYQYGVTVQTDGGSHEEIKIGLEKAKDMFAQELNNNQRLDPMPLWNDFTSVIDRILKNAVAASNGTS